MLQTQQYQRLQEEFKTLICTNNWAGTATTYTTPVTQLLIWLEQNGITKIKEVQTSMMVEYYEYLTTRPNERRGGTLSESTIKGHLFAMSVFFEYLQDAGEIKSGFVIPKFKSTKGEERQSLTEKEIQQLYLVVTSKLERALLSTAYGCGLRRTELNKLNTQDIQFNKGVMIVVSGKGNKRREVPMSEGVIRDLKDYFINERSEYLRNHNKLELAFFVNQKGKRMDGECMNDLIKEISERTNNEEILKKNITLHCLRHSIAEHLVIRGATIEFVRDVLGHADIDTSYLYAVKNRNKKIFAL